MISSALAIAVVYGALVVIGGPAAPSTLRFRLTFGFSVPVLAYIGRVLLVGTGSNSDSGRSPAARRTMRGGIGAGAGLVAILGGAWWARSHGARGPAYFVVGTVTFAGIPVLLVGLAMVWSGWVLSRRTSGSPTSAPLDGVRLVDVPARSADSRRHALTVMTRAGRIRWCAAAILIGLLGFVMLGLGLLMLAPSPDDPHPFVPSLVIAIMGVLAVAMAVLLLIAARRLRARIDGTTLTFVWLRSWSVDLARVDRAEVIGAGNPDTGFQVPMLRLGSHRPLRSLRLKYAGGLRLLPAEDLRQLAAALAANPDQSEVEFAITALTCLAKDSEASR